MGRGDGARRRGGESSPREVKRSRRYTLRPSTISSIFSPADAEEGLLDREETREAETEQGEPPAGHRRCWVDGNLAKQKCESARGKPSVLSGRGSWKRGETHKKRQSRLRRETRQDKDAERRGLHGDAPALYASLSLVYLPDTAGYQRRRLDDVPCVEVVLLLCRRRRGEKSARERRKPILKRSFALGRSLGGTG